MSSAGGGRADVEAAVQPRRHRPPRAISPAGCRQLWSAVLGQAVRDLGHDKHRQDALDYFAGPAFRLHARLLELDPDTFLRHLDLDQENQP